MNTIKINVIEWQENDDTYTIGFWDANLGAVRFWVPGLLLPLIIRTFGEPSELVGKTFEVTLP
jgi:hypothetical protein